MKTLYLWIMLAMLAMASCSSHDEPELIEPVPPAQEDEPKTVNVQFVVGEYPAFASQGNASDDDKTAWSEADEIFVTFTSPKLGKKTAVLTYRNNAWTTGSTLSYSVYTAILLLFPASLATEYNTTVPSLNSGISFSSNLLTNP